MKRKLLLVLLSIAMVCSTVFVGLGASAIAAPATSYDMLYNAEGGFAGVSSNATLDGSVYLGMKSDMTVPTEASAQNAVFTIVLDSPIDPTQSDGIFIKMKAPESNLGFRLFYIDSSDRTWKGMVEPSNNIFVKSDGTATTLKTNANTHTFINGQFGTLYVPWSDIKSAHSSNPVSGAINGEAAAGTRITKIAFAYPITGVWYRNMGATVSDIGTVKINGANDAVATSYFDTSALTYATEAGDATKDVNPYDVALGTKVYARSVCNNNNFIWTNTANATHAAIINEGVSRSEIGRVGLSDSNYDVTVADNGTVIGVNDKTSTSDAVYMGMKSDAVTVPNTFGIITIDFSSDINSALYTGMFIKYSCPENLSGYGFKVILQDSNGAFWRTYNGSQRTDPFVLEDGTVSGVSQKNQHSFVPGTGTLYIPFNQIRTYCNADGSAATDAAWSSTSTKPVFTSVSFMFNINAAYYFGKGISVATVGVIEPFKGRVVNCFNSADVTYTEDAGNALSGVNLADASKGTMVYSKYAASTTANLIYLAGSETAVAASGQCDFTVAPEAILNDVHYNGGTPEGITIPDGAIDATKCSIIFAMIDYGNIPDVVIDDAGICVTVEGEERFFSAQDRISADGKFGIALFDASGEHEVRAYVEFRGEKIYSDTLTFNFN